MTTAKIKTIHDISRKKGIPFFGPGYTVSVHQKIKEGNKERIQIFTGLVIAMNSGSGADKTFTVRKIVDGIGVEKIFPLYSSNIEKIVPIKKAKIRRAKLYYIRERSGKSARFKEKHLSKDDILVPEEEITGEVEATEEELQEAKVKIEKEEAEKAAEVNAEEVKEENSAETDVAEQTAEQEAKEEVVEESPEEGEKKD